MSVATLVTDYDPHEDIDGLTLTELLRAVPGLTYRCVDYWTRTGLLRTARPAHGSGTQRIWAPEEDEVLRRVLPLTRLGIHPRVAFELARVGQVSLAPQGLLVYDTGATYVEQETTS